MEKGRIEKHDSSSDQSPSDKEHIDDPVAIIDREVPDPDAHLSEEERKRIVCPC